jgi:methylenetetrahydrofolate reductase (NADPH)
VVYDDPVAFLLQQKRPLLSLEFFPPKTEAAAEELLINAEAIATHLRPDFVSITCGAGGSARELTYAYSQILKQRFGWTIVPHLTCAGQTRDSLLGTAESYARMGVKSLMALRGDPPSPRLRRTLTSEGTAWGGEFQHADQLVALLKQEYPDLCLGVAGYPEKHPEAPTIDEDLAHLKHKVSRGASFVTTQLFFEASVYKNFMDRCRGADIRAPIIPGLLPAVSLEQVQKFCRLTRATLPQKLLGELQSTAPEDQWKIGVEWTHNLIKELLALGAPGIHLYILNRSRSVLQLAQRLNKERIFRRA